MKKFKLTRERFDHLIKEINNELGVLENFLEKMFRKCRKYREENKGRNEVYSKNPDQ